MKFGTRGSKLALIQTQKVIDALKAHYPDLKAEIVVIQTSGDWKPSHGETLLSAAAGGKGLFAKEIEAALLDGRIDAGVHSMKDMETFMPKELSIKHVLERDDPRDAFISPMAASLDELPEGAVIGTSSIRRASIILSRRPDLKIVPLRGNVDTRLRKLDDNQVDATLLAVAGLDRLGISDKITSYLEPEAMLPAVCQGTIGVQTRADDTKAQSLLDSIHHEPTGLQTIAERAVLAVLDGSCRTPIGSYAQWMNQSTMRLRALVASTDGTEIFKHEETAPIQTQDDAHALGLRVGNALKALTPADYLKVHG
jgi:hydroxymethylbilane synthase